jgi:hypothetical protein
MKLTNCISLTKLAWHVNYRAGTDYSAVFKVPNVNSSYLIESESITESYFITLL